MMMMSQGLSTVQVKKKSFSPFRLCEWNIWHEIWFFSGTQVTQVFASDPDDPLEGKNAHLVYSLQKNVIDESSGAPIFTVDKYSGNISTALCCLNREHTTHYMLQLAATDGGGLQGIAVLELTLIKVNCNSILIRFYFLTLKFYKLVCFQQHLTDYRQTWLKPLDTLHYIIV